MTREEAIRIIRIVLVIAADFEITVQGEELTEEKCKEAVDMAIKALEIEPLTDKEQRIFLAAMGREEKVCREVDNEYPDREAYEDSLVSVCRSIERKVKKALW